MGGCRDEGIESRVQNRCLEVESFYQGERRAYRCIGCFRPVQRDQDRTASHFFALRVLLCC